MTATEDCWAELIVERDDALALADRIADDLSLGRSSLLQVMAPPGGGLTTVLDEVATRVRARGALVGRARCSPDEVTVEFRAAWQFLAALGVDQSAVAADVRVLCRAVLAEAGRHPVAIVVDDAQWMDRASFELLRALVRRLGHQPLVVAVGVSVQCASMITADELGPATHELRLHRLTRSGVEQLLAAVYPLPIAPEFVDALFERTSGSPAVVRRVLTWLDRMSVAPDADAVARVAELATSVLTERVDSRIRALSLTSRRLLHAIAVCADIFDAREAAALAGLGATFLGDVAALGASGLLVRRCEPRFAHPLVADRVSALATRAEREELHAAAAELANRVALGHETVARLVLGTGPLGTPWALTALREAAKSCLQRGDHREAARLLDRALAEPVTPEQRARLLVDCGAVEVSPDAADRRLTAALAVRGGPEIGRRRLAAVDLLLTRGNCDLVRQAIATVHTRPDLDDAERETMCALYWMADEAPQDQRELSPAVLPMPQGDPVEPAYAAIAAWEAVGEGRDLERARRLARTTLASRERLLYPGILAARALIYTDDFAESIDAFDALVLQARRRRLPASAGLALLMRSFGHLRQGMVADSALDLERALAELPLERWHPGVRPSFVGTSLILALESGRMDDAVRIAATEFPATARAGFSWNFFLFARALLRLRTGDPATAATIFEETGRRLLSRRWTNPALLPWRTLCATAYHHLGRAEEAARLVADEVRLARRWGDATSVGGAHLIAAGAVGGNEAVTHLEQAAAILRHAPSPARYAHALAELGEARLGAGQADDARPLLIEAVRIAATHGATGLASRVRALLASP